MATEYVFVWELIVKINSENENKNHVENVAIQRRKSEKYFQLIELNIYLVKNLFNYCLSN